MITKLTQNQKERVLRLENALQIASSKGDLNSAKLIVADLQPLFTATGNSARFLQARIRLYEAAMEAGMLSTAESGLINVRAEANKNTRTHLEASVLLAICYLRLKSILKAEPIIREVLINDKVITSTEKRRVFRKNIIDRFDEEGLLFAISDEKSPKLKYDYNEIEKEAADLIRRNFNEDEMFENIGNIVPNSAKNILLQVDQFSKKQLPSAERIGLPSGTEMLENKKVGKTLFSSVKRVLYKSICDKESEVYKSWYQYGISGVTTLITVAVADVLNKLSVTIRGIIVAVAALVIKFGIAVYCEHYKPQDIMSLR